MVAHQRSVRQRVARFIDRVAAQAEWRTGAVAKTILEHTIRDESDFARHVDYIHFNPVKHAWCNASVTGRIPRFTVMCAKACCRTTGPAMRAAKAEISASDRHRRSPHERSDMRGGGRQGPGYRFAHPGYATDLRAGALTHLAKNGAPVRARRCLKPSAGSVDQLVGREKAGYFSLPSATLAGHTVTCLPSCHWNTMPLTLSGPYLRPWVNWSLRP